MCGVSPAWWLNSTQWLVLYVIQVGLGEGWLTDAQEWWWLLGQSESGQVAGGVRQVWMEVVVVVGAVLQAVDRWACILSSEIHIVLLIITVLLVIPTDHHCSQYPAGFTLTVHYSTQSSSAFTQLEQLLSLPLFELLTATPGPVHSLRGGHSHLPNPNPSIYNPSVNPKWAHPCPNQWSICNRASDITWSVPAPNPDCALVWINTTGTLSTPYLSVLSGNAYWSSLWIASYT